MNLSQAATFLDVGLLEETEAAGDAERNVAAGQLELQFQGVEMGAIEHRHLVQIDSLLAQLQHALGNKGGLLAAVAASDQHRLDAAGARQRPVAWETAGRWRQWRSWPAAEFPACSGNWFRCGKWRHGVAVGELQNVQEMGGRAG